MVELASLLGGERFSDRPRCVCKVIAAFLRSLNDRLSHADRQRLRPYASRAVGSRAGVQITRMRRDACLSWAGARLDESPFRAALERLAVRARILAIIGLRQAIRLDEGAGEYAARLVFARDGAEGGFALLEELLSIGEPAAAMAGNGSRRNGAGPLEAPPLAHPVEVAAQTRVAAAVRQLAGHPEVAQGENGGQRANHNGHPRHLGGRDAGQRHEEDIEHDHAGNGNPERKTKLTQ